MVDRSTIDTPNTLFSYFHGLKQAFKKNSGGVKLVLCFQTPVLSLVKNSNQISLRSKGFSLNNKNPMFSNLKLYLIAQLTPSADVFLIVYCLAM